MDEHSYVTGLRSERRKPSRRPLAKRKSQLLKIVAGLCLVALAPSLSGQQQEPEPKPLRFDVAPFAGYRTSMSFPIEPHVSGTNPTVVLEANPSYGASFGVRLSEGGLVEGRWARQDSYVHSEGITPATPRQHLVLNQFHLDCSREYVVDPWPQWARPFVMLSVGATHLSGSATADFTRFSFGMGGGIRFYPSRHVGFKVQAEWVPVLVDPQVSFVCGGGCVIHVGSTLASQGEVVAGPFFRF